MVEPAEHLSLIRADLAGDLVKIEEDLLEARTAATEAEVAHQAAVAEWAALNELAARGGETFTHTEGQKGISTLAAPLHSRLLGARDELIRPAEQARGRARARVSSLEQQRSILTDSLWQIDRALSGERGGIVTRLPPAPKRVAPTVEFNNVTMPKDAA